MFYGPGFITRKSWSGDITAAIAAHEAAADPHPQYLTQAEADALYVAIANSFTRGQAIALNELTFSV